MKIAVYARVSTLLSQDPEHQLIPARELAEARAFIVTNEYIDHIGGTADRRPEVTPEFRPESPLIQSFH